MNHEEHIFSKLDLPKIKQHQEHKKHLRKSLLLAHQEYSNTWLFGNVINNTIKNMTTLQKGLAFSTIAIAGLVIIAGTFGPSAYSVANAQAQETINRAFARIANLSDEEKVELQEKFQGRIIIKENSGKFLGPADMSPEELEARNQKTKASLTDLLAEAKLASDLQIISADELPVSGFLGQAGRAIGFKMMHKTENFEEKLANLPEDVRLKIKENKTFCEEMRPVSFMVYTNAEGQIVHLGINAENEPVAVFISPKNGENTHPQHGKKFFSNSKGNAK